MQAGSLNPASLPPGTWVGPWRIVDLRGGGAHGVVYLVQGDKGQAALKLALKPLDARFGREVALLSRIRCPSVPQIVDNGEWHPEEGAPRPYLVMEWVEGVPLYEWARVRRPGSRQVLQVLASLARALEATHKMGGVHRDVKGDNVLVRLEDSRAFLIDFGSSSYKGAEPITAPVFPPGTREYRSPEAIRFAINILQSSIKVYAPKPTDDVFALGVTAYRLVTGEYPPTADPSDEEAEVWEEGGTGPVPAGELNSLCAPELSQLISRMLSLRPEARGSAGALADALERTAREAGAEADESLFTREASQSVEVEAVPRALVSEVPHPARFPPRLVAVAVVLGTFLGLLIWRRHHSVQVRSGEGDAGTVAVGDSVLTAPAASDNDATAWSSIALEVPSKPLPEQVRPDANGDCPYKDMVVINGGCWIRMKGGTEACKTYGYVYKGVCYEPFFRHVRRPSTSEPVEARDGGSR